MATAFFSVVVCSFFGGGFNAQFFMPPLHGFPASIQVTAYEGTIQLQVGVNWGNVEKVNHARREGFVSPSRATETYMVNHASAVVRRVGCIVFRMMTPYEEEEEEEGEGEGDHGDHDHDHDHGHDHDHDHGDHDHDHDHGM